jgi:hypothetical protein
MEVILDYYKLPEKFHKNHRVAFIFHDTIANCVRLWEENEMSMGTLSLKNKNELMSIETSNESIITWLLNNGYKDTAKKLVMKFVFHSILADFCHYVYESLVASAKCKLSVAFTLLRKPFKDSLFYLEWFIHNSDEFFDCFMENPEAYAIDKISADRKKEIIKGVVNKIDPMWPQFETDLYNYRYDKQSLGGEQFWNRANHLVTTCKHFRTNTGDINFVFMTPDVIEELWNQYYKLVPFLLAYTQEIVFYLMQFHIRESD